MSNFKQIRLAICAVHFVLGVCSLSAQAAPVSGQGTWETTLQARDINGDGIVDAYYDTALNITWLANWNANGTMTWDAAVAWATGLDVYGVTGWRLPTTTDTGTPGCNFSYAGGTDCGYTVDPGSGEMAHMFFVTLGNLALCDPSSSSTSICTDRPPGWGLTNTANFINMQSEYYWAGTEYAPVPGNAWYFRTVTGLQNIGYINDGMYAVAVRPGDVAGAAVPEPASLALLGLGLAGLGFGRRRNQKAA